MHDKRRNFVTVKRSHFTEAATQLLLFKQLSVSVVEATLRKLEHILSSQNGNSHINVGYGALACLGPICVGNLVEQPRYMTVLNTVTRILDTTACTRQNYWCSRHASVKHRLCFKIWIVDFFLCQPCYEKFRKQKKGGNLVFVSLTFQYWNIYIDIVAPKTTVRTPVSSGKPPALHVLSLR